MSEGVTFRCMGPCERYYPASQLKISAGEGFCSGCYPKPLPAKDVKAPQMSGPRLDWRNR